MFLLFFQLRYSDLDTSREVCGEWQLVPALPSLLLHPILIKV